MDAKHRDMDAKQRDMNAKQRDMEKEVPPKAFSFLSK